MTAILKNLLDPARVPELYVTTAGRVEGVMTAVTEPKHRSMGLRMKEARLELGLTQEDLAELTGITSRMIHEYESGRAKPNARRSRDLAQALGKSIPWLMFGREDQVSLEDFSRRLDLLLETGRMQLLALREQNALLERLLSSAASPGSTVPAPPEE